MAPPAQMSAPLTAVVLAALALHSGMVDAAADSFCYEIKYDLANPAGPTTKLLRPVTHFPVNHPSVTKGVCGGYAAGDRLPAAGKWSTKGKTSASDKSCDTVSAGELLYSYNYPYKYSSNTGYSEFETDSLYFVVDDAGSSFFVVTHDRPSNSDGGRIAFSIDSPDLRGKAVQVLLADDNKKTYSEADKCVGKKSECYAWDDAEGAGSMSWKWSRCCTDGMVLGPMPSSDYCFNLQYTLIEGVDRWHLGSYNSATNDLDVVALEQSAVSAGVQVCGRTCEDYCARLTTCGKCASSPTCSWCPGTGCVDSSTAPATCASGSAPAATCAACTDCAAHATLRSCTSAEGCGWCFKDGKCVPEDGGNALCGSTCAAGEDEWFQDQWITGMFPARLLCDGAIDQAQSPVDATTQSASKWCNGHGECKVTGRSTDPEFTDVVTSRACTCDRGYAGDGCGRTCPGGVGNPCTGHGVCTASGICACECGWQGAACSIASDCTSRSMASGTWCMGGDECKTKCGKHVGPPSAKYWTGSRGTDGSCTCAPGWTGEDCGISCPGMSASTGQGTECAGAGKCIVDPTDATKAICECEACADRQSDGTCKQQSCPVCQHSGVCVCDADSNTRKCNCPGKFAGNSCESCGCLNQDAGTRCNSITGECVCPQTGNFYGELCWNLPTLTVAPRVKGSVIMKVADTSDPATTDAVYRLGFADLRTGETIKVDVPLRVNVGKTEGVTLTAVLDPGLKLLTAVVSSVASNVRLTKKPRVDLTHAPVSETTLSFGHVYNEGTVEAGWTVTLTLVSVASAGDPGAADMQLFSRTTNDAGTLVAERKIFGSSVDLVYGQIEVAASARAVPGGGVPCLLEQGNKVALRAVISHASVSTASGFQPSILFMLPHDTLAYDSFSVLSKPSSMDKLTAAAVPDGVAISYTGVQPLRVGESIYVEVVASVIASAAPFAAITTRVTALYLTQMVSEGLDEGFENGFGRASDPVNVDLVAAAPALSVQVTATDVAGTVSSQHRATASDLVPGEVADFTVDTRVPSGTFSGYLAVALPPGLTHVSSHISFIGGKVSRAASSTGGIALNMAGVAVAGATNTWGWPLGRMFSDPSYSGGGADFDIVRVVVRARCAPSSSTVSDGAALEPVFTLFYDDSATNGGTTLGAQPANPCTAANKFGAGCDVSCSPATTCTGHGVCDSLTGRCACDIGWSGAKCSSSSSATSCSAVPSPQIHQHRAALGVDVVEPSLSIGPVTASTTVTTGGQQVTLSATLSVGAGATADAQEVVIRDASAVAGSSKLYTVMSATYTVGGGSVQVAGVDGTSVSLPTVALGSGDIAVSYVVQIENGLPTGSSVSSRASLHYSSAPVGAGRVARSYSSDAPSQASVALAATDLSASLTGLREDGTVVVGGVFAARAVVVLPAGSSTNTVVTVKVDPGATGQDRVELLPSNPVLVVASNSDVTSSCGAIDATRVTAATSTSVTVSLCDLVNVHSGAGDVEETITVTVQARVRDVAAATDGSTLTLAATLQSDTHALSTEVASAKVNGGPSALTSVLSVPFGGSSNTEAAFSVSYTLSHPGAAGAASAFSATASVKLPYPSFSVSSTGVGSIASLINASGLPALPSDPAPLFTLISATASELLGGQTLEAAAVVSVAAGTTPGGPALAVVADAVWFSQTVPATAGTQPRSYSDAKSASVTVACDAGLTCTANGACAEDSNGAPNGLCRCDSGFAGTSCNKCDPNKLGACHGAGSCNSDGTCACFDTAGGTFCELERLPSPQQNPSGGTHIDSVSVTLSSTTPGGTIHFTIDGSDPSESSPTYSSPVAFSTKGRHTLKAIVVKAGTLTSVVASRTFTVTNRAASPRVMPLSGTYVERVSGAATCATAGATIWYTVDGTAPEPGAPGTSQYTGAFDVNDVGSTVTVSAVSVAAGFAVSNPTVQTYTIIPRAAAVTFSPTSSGPHKSNVTVVLASATAGASIVWTSDGTTPTSSSALYTAPLVVSGASTTTLRAVARKDGMGDAAVSSKTYIIQDVVANPIFSPNGGTHTLRVDVALASATGGARLYYTTDGSAPTTSSTLYTGPIVLTTIGTTTVRAIGVKDKHFPSVVTSASFVVQDLVATPVISTDPSGAGPFSPSVTVEISCGTSGAAILYSLDGSAPSTAYTAPIVLDQSSVGSYTVKASASQSGWTSSGTATKSFDVLQQVSAVTFSPPGGLLPHTTQITLSTGTSGSTIYWSTDLEASLGSFSVYSGPVTVESATFRAYATKSGFGDSVVSEVVATKMAVVEQPVFSPGGGTFTTSVNIDVASATAGSVTRYTTDGSTPTSSSTVASGSIVWNTVGTTVFKAFSQATSSTDSVVTTRSFTVLTQLLDPTMSPLASTGPFTTSVALTLTAGGGHTPEVWYTLDGSSPSSSNTAVRYSGVPVVLGVGMHTVRAFARKGGAFAASSVTTATYVVRAQVVAPELSPSTTLGPFSPTVSVAAATVTTGASLHYTADGTAVTSSSPALLGTLDLGVGTHTINVIAVKSGWTDSVVTSAVYTVLPQAAAASATLPSAATSAGAFSPSVTVDLSSITTGAAIWYTLDGSKPVPGGSASILYSGPFVIATVGVTDITAVVVADGFGASAVSTTTVSVVEQVATPSISPPGGDHDTVVMVSMSVATSSAFIFYTTDGSTPTEQSLVYSAPFPLTVVGLSKVRARAFKSGMGPSVESAVKYNVYSDSVVIEDSNGCPGPHLYGPDCVFCHARLSCNSNGWCSPRGQCICDLDHAGSDCSLAARCTVSLGSAGAYGAFVRNSFSAPNGGRVAGALAVGGDATFSHYSVGDSLPPPADRETRFDLVVRGALRASHAAVLGGGSAISGDIANSNVSVSFGVSPPGAMTFGPSPIHFELAFIRMAALSDRLYALPRTGTTRREWSSFYLVGTRLDINVFTITTTQLHICRALYLTLPAAIVNASDHLTVINVVPDHSPSSAGRYKAPAENAEIKSFAMLGDFENPYIATRIIFNFAKTNGTLTLDKLDVEGHVFAPLAHVDFPFGNVHGRLFARSFAGHGFIGSEAMHACGPTGLDLGDGSAQFGETSIPPLCGIGGDLVENRCVCRDQWRGELCTERCVDYCSGRGNCIAGNTDLCTCWNSDWFEGDRCEKSRCGPNGFVRALDANDQGICVCTQGWTGDKCDQQIPCVYGRWVGSICQCHKGWTGDSCNSPVALPERAIVCKHGVTLLDGSCLCQVGYTGADCSVFAGVHTELAFYTCYRGRWDFDRHRCICEVGWYGDNCDQRTCINGVPRLDETTQEAVCDCFDGWFDDRCGTHCRGACYFQGDACTGALPDNQCVCDSGFVGLQCEQTTVPAGLASPSTVPFGGVNIGVDAAAQPDNPDSTLFVAVDAASCDIADLACVSMVVDVDYPTVGDPESIIPPDERLRRLTELHELDEEEQEEVAAALAAEAAEAAERGEGAPDAIQVRRARADGVRAVAARREHGTVRPHLRNRSNRTLARRLQEGDAFGSPVDVVVQLPLGLLSSQWEVRLMPLESADETSHADHVVSRRDASRCNRRETFDITAGVLRSKVCHSAAYSLYVKRVEPRTEPGVQKGVVSATGRSASVSLPAALVTCLATVAALVGARRPTALQA